MTRWIAAVCVSGALVLLAGCAGAQRQEALLEEARDFIYPLPLEEVWPQVQKFVNDEGFPARNDPKHFVLVTDWRSDLRDSRVASASSRLFVAGYRLNRGNCVVRIFRHTVMTGNRGGVDSKANRYSPEMMPITSEDVPFEDPIGMSHRSGDNYQLIRPMPHLSRFFTRDVGLEWALLQKLAPEEARELTARADSHISPLPPGEGQGEGSWARSSTRGPP